MSTQNPDLSLSPQAVDKSLRHDSIVAELNYIAHNPEGKSTILLIHGAFASARDWDLVSPYLTDSYQLLIPDLPSHGQSRNIKPFSIETSSRLLAQLISKRAIDGRAHVVGHSLGAHIAVDLASRYPELVNMVFVSGFEIYPPTALSPYLPHCVWAMQRVENLVPRPVIRWLMDGAALTRTDTDTCTLDLCRQIVATMNSVTWPLPWPARTLIVAAGKGGIVPSSDHPHDAVKLMGIGRKRNSETVAFTHSAMRHPWNRQAPHLFAETVCAWFQREQLPEGFRKL